MKIRAATIIGPLVSLAFVGALMLPEADPDSLAAQGFGRLLETDLDGAFDPSEGAPAFTPGGPADQSVFRAVHLAADGLPTPRMSRDIALGGLPIVRKAFDRALASSINRYNALRADAGLPPIAEASAAAPAHFALSLDLRSSGGKLTLHGRVIGLAGPTEITQTDADGAPRSWSIPGRTALLPPLIAILVALLFRKVLIALFSGILIGSILLARQADPALGWIGAAWSGFVDVFATYLHHELVDTFRVEIMGFVIALVAMVGVMSRSGGVHGLVELLLRFARTVRSTLAVTWGMGLLIFFDDYTNCLLVGNTMRPLTDRMRISREKLAYIVDSTAAPIAGISLLSTWIAFEVSTYSAQLPGVGITDSAYAVVVQTIPFRFYCLFTLMFVGLNILTRRDFGPMLTAERRARSTGEVVRKGGRPLVGAEATRIEPKEGIPLDWRAAAFPIGLVLAMTIARIFLDGGGLELWRADPGSLLTMAGVTSILSGGGGAGPIFTGALCGYVLVLWMVGSNVLRWGGLIGFTLAAVFHTDLALWLKGSVPGGAVGYLAWTLPLFGGWVLAMLARPVLPSRGRTVRPHLDGRDIGRSSLSSVRALFFAVLILLQAWMIGAVCGDIKTADYLVALTSGAVPPIALPALLFVVAGLVALSTGSSWSTMSILMPNVVALAAAVGSEHEIGSIGMVIVCIGSVLEGSILGDHCSPLSDTTVLSSVSSASDHVDHVRTQMPYALLCGGAAIFLGYLPTVIFPGWSFMAAMGTGAALFLGCLLIFGRRVPDAPLDALQG
jgi:Na+/H+ antiporter NhaC